MNVSVSSAITIVDISNQSEVLEADSVLSLINVHGAKKGRLCFLREDHSHGSYFMNR